MAALKLKTSLPGHVGQQPHAHTCRLRHATQEQMEGEATPLQKTKLLRQDRAAQIDHKTT